jgi:hypothetical protein
MKKVIFISIILGMIFPTWLLSPIILKKYIIAQAQNHGWNLQIQSVKIKSLNQLGLIGVKASKEGIKADIQYAIINLNDHLKPELLFINGGTIDIRQQNVRKINISQSKLNIQARYLTVTSNMCGGVTAKGVSIDKINGKISAIASEITGNCFGFDSVAKQINLSNSILKVSYLITNYQKPSQIKNTNTLKEKFDTHGIEVVAIDNLILNSGNTSIKATNLFARSINDGYSADFITADISSESLESPIEIQKGELRLNEIKDHEVKFELSLGKISLKNASLSQKTLDTKTVNATGTLTLNDNSKQLTSTILSNEVMIGININKNKDSLQLDTTLFKIPCDQLIESIPSGMIDKLSDFKFSGNIFAELNIDTSPPKPKVKISLQNGCRITKAPPSMNVSNFRKTFTRFVQDANDKPIEIESGPGSKWWIPLNSIPRYMPRAVMTTEDAGFERHNGFIIQAIENSIAMDIESGKFTRGGSTISMQLAKNLWLSRTKTISRKLQEFFLTTYLEQSMSKNEIMELYLNIVELGPGIYGIGQAASEYFNKSAASLTLGECLFLSSILPAPKQPKFNVDGLLYKQWADYLQTLMKLMANKEYISEDELNLGLTEQIRKGGSESKSEPQIQIKDAGVNPNSWITN